MHRSILITVAVLVAGATTPAAWADDPAPPPGGPAINQYVETVPSGTGGQAVGVGKSRSKPLPKKAAKKLDVKTTSFAPTLRSIATSSSYGAPQQTLRQTKPTPSKHSAKPSATPKAPRSVDRTDRTAEANRTALSAAVSAATGGGDRGPVILLAVIVLLTTAVGIAAAARRARHGR